jgi:DNA-binding winged helix-turn-helix (wHTH) protein
VSTRTLRGVRIYRFGEFELDIRAAELRRNGEKVRLQEQPYRLLLMLLEHPGEVVLREEIRKRLWPNDTVVEISHGINAAVLRLRDALGESAEYPRRIETVARRGYRFQGEVEVLCRPIAPAGSTAVPGRLDTPWYPVVS